ncbi:MAG: hypothetical protein JXA62_08525 [Candidatus Aminicenantes bacterium]|nr:hypothetical protein [Candidatus Aminicenantes bacterium]
MTRMSRCRIAFLLPGGEPWVRKVVADLVPVLTSLEGECVFLSEGPAARDLGGAWIELDGIDTNPAFRRMYSSYTVAEPSVEESRREFRYCRARFDEKFSLEQVRTRYQGWMKQARALYRLVQPDQVWIWNGVLYRGAAFAASATQMGLPVFYAEKGAMPGSWALDPRGTNGASSLLQVPEPAPEPGRVTAMRKEISQWDQAGRSAWGQPERMKAEELEQLREKAAGRKVVFFPGQVDIDSNVICFSPHFRGSGEALDFLVRNLADEYFFLVKPHPMGGVSGEDYREIVGERGFVIKDIHVLDAVEVSDLVATINSTVGFEAAVRGKPVFLLGRGILSERSFVRQWVPGQPLEAQVESWLGEYVSKRDEQEEKAFTWAAFLMDEYYLFLEDRERLRKRLSRTVSCARNEADHRFCLNLDEIVTLLSPLSPEEQAAGLQGRDLLRLACRKARKRVRGFGNTGEIK